MRWAGTGYRLLRLMEEVQTVALSKFISQLLFEVLLDFALRHQRQVVERGGWYSHLLKLLLRIGLDRERQLNLIGWCWMNHLLSLILLEGAVAVLLLQRVGLLLCLSILNMYLLRFA